MKARISVLLLFISLVTFASNENERKLYKQGHEALLNENYDAAADFFTELTKADEQNSEYHFLTGFSYFNLPGKKQESIPYFKTAIKKTTKDTISEAYYYLGLAQMYDEQYEAARASLTTFKRFIQKDTRQGEVLAIQVNDLIASTNNAIEYQQNSNDALKINNLGEAVNSPYPDYAPVMNPDSDFMIFTSRRASTTGGKKAFDGEYNEDILVAKKTGDSWAITENDEQIDDLLHDFHNTKKHDAGVLYSKDGNTLYIYRKNVVWKSENKNGEWTAPKREEIFDKEHKHVPSIALTNDGKKMFFVSRIEGGFGNHDLYYTTLQEDGSWGQPVNLGETVNTHKSEDAPFISADGKHLYFSSNGHKGMGGYDIYKVALGEGGEVGEITNLGYPLNSPADDIFYIELENDEHGLISSDRKGTIGDMDIFEFEYIYPAILATVKGIAVNPTTKQPLRKATIVLSNKDGDEIQVQTDDKGEYTYQVMSDKEYDIQINARNTETYSNSFYIPKITKNYESFQHIEINRLQNNDGQDTAEVLRIRSSFANLDSEIKEKGISRYDVIASYDYSNNTDSYFVELRDTVNYDIKTLATMGVGQSFKKTFGYNEHVVGEQEAIYTDWLAHLSNVVKANGSATVTIEGSASKVPTSTFRSNQSLAKARAKKVRKMAEKDIKKLGIDLKLITWKEENKVQGPAYANDAENTEKYKEFQYVNVEISK